MHPRTRASCYCLRSNAGAGLLALLVLVATGGRAATQEQKKEPPARPPKVERPLPPIIKHVPAEDMIVIIGDPADIVEMGGLQVITRDTNQNVAEFRQRLEALLKAEIDDVDRGCSLTEDQKRKLFLAGRGDVARFLDRNEVTRQEQVLLGRRGGLVRLGGIQPLGGFQPDNSFMSSALETGIFGESSLLYKSLRNTLTEEQRLRYAANRMPHFHAAIEDAVRFLERRSRMDGLKRGALVKLLQSEIMLVGRPSQHDYYRILVQMGTLPEEKLKPFFDEGHWSDVRQICERYQLLEPHLKAAGRFQDEVVIEGFRPAVPAPPIPLVPIRR